MNEGAFPYLLPVIGAFIGWVTNYIAVLMLFHPHRKVNILGFTLQGVFPHRQVEFARKMGHLVAGELFTVEQVTSRMTTLAASKQNLDLLAGRIEVAALQRLLHEVPPLRFILRPRHIKRVVEYCLPDIRRVILEMSGRITSELHQELDVQKIVEEKIASFSSEKLEEIVFSIMRKEFRSIEIVGGVLGFLIGLVQMFLAMI